ncbi:MAG: L,D-transpeptidase [Solirubrobacteraceae bacterium]
MADPAAVATPRPAALTRLGVLARYAFVERPTPVRAQPFAGSRIVGRVSPLTFWGTSTPVLALKRTGHFTEVRISAAWGRDSTGWVLTGALSPLHPLHTWLRVDRESFTASLLRDGRVVFRAPVGVGQPQWPTPAGQFFVEESIAPPQADGLYGPVAFGTSAHSSVLTSWANQGQVGIHGTNEPWLIPGRISHGCIRLRNSDIRRLAHLMPVGTPVTIF